MRKINKIRYIVKTQKGYYKGIDYGNHYNMKEQKVEGWQVSGGCTYERIIFTSDLKQAKELYRTELITLLKKLDDLFKINLEKSNKIEIIIRSEK